MFVDNEGARLWVEVDGAEELPALLLWPNGSVALRVWDHMVPKLSYLESMMQLQYPP